MLLSIIIPVYNVEEYLTECLDSVFSQDLNDCEIISVNDGSKDTSRQILSDYQKKNPELIIIDQENGGLSEARNAGLKVAKGEYIYFLDSDDYLLPEVIEKINKSIQQSKCEVIGFNATANGITIYIPSFIVANFGKSGISFFSDFYYDNGFYPFFNIALYVYRKSFLDHHNLYFKKGIYHEDILFTLHVFYYTTSICGYNIPIFNYRQNREGSITTNIKLKNLSDKSKICRELDCFYQEHNFENKHFYNTIFYIYIFTIYQALQNGYSEKKYYYTKEDKIIMRKGILSDYEYKLWLLASIDIKLMVAFYNNQLNNYFRRLINVVFSFLFKLKKTH